MVFQSPALYPHMSVYENLGFGLKLRGCPRSELDERVREAAEMLGLVSCLTSKPMALSGGQRQRVAIGRAIVRRPSVLLLDEPLANIDPTLRTQMRNELTNLVRRFGATMIYVTHDHLEAMLLGDRVAVVREGVLQQISEPLGLYNRPANLFVAGFIGSPPMNLFTGVLVRRASAWFFRAESGRCLRLELASAPHLERYLDKAIVLGMRPEHIACGPPESGASGDATIEGKILAVQPAGPDTYLQLCAGGILFAARVPASSQVRPGQWCACSLDMGQARLFDPGTGNAISN